MLRTIFEAECSLSSTEGILGKEQPLEVLKTSVLNHIPTGWTVCLCVNVSTLVCVSVCLCVCATPVRDFTVNHILCDFACPVLPFTMVLMPFLFLCNSEGQLRIRVMDPASVSIGPNDSCSFLFEDKVAEVPARYFIMRKKKTKN